MKISSFPPIIDAHSQVLILGTVPGVRSWEMKQYYAHPQNQFWKMVFDLFDEPYTSDYEVRKRVLLQNHLALWDVIDTCERKGSLDAAIRNEETNQIHELLEEFPRIAAVCCNGQLAFKNVKKILPTSHPLPVLLLPSTSPAYAAKRYEEKREAWKVILNYL